MTLTRGIPLTIHGALEVVLAPAVMVAPFVLGFGQAATVIAIVFGALLMALALQVEGSGRVVPISAHADFDYALATFAIIGGLAIGIGLSAWTEAAFLVGVGIVQVMLTASTRFTIAREA
jgi:hypothetical protein